MEGPALSQGCTPLDGRLFLRALAAEVGAGAFTVYCGVCVVRVVFALAVAVGSRCLLALLCTVLGLSQLESRWLPVHHFPAQRGYSLSRG